MKIVKKEVSSICAILIIIMLTISDILLIGKEAVSYALDMAKIAENVSFVSYFIDEKGNKVQKLERNISDEEYLYVDIMVENEGYLNGSIYIEDNNFNLSQEIVSPGIEKIEGNRVDLNQISAGATSTIKLKIEAIKDDIVTLNLLNGKTKVSLRGEYINSKGIEKGNYIKIDSYTSVEMDWNSDEEIWANLDADIITNSNVTLNGEEKKLVQVKVKSNLEKNDFPLKSSNFEIEVGELEAEKVTVFAKDLSGTNAALNLKEEKYSYNENAGKYQIKVENLDENAISWKKETSDTIIVSFILDKEVNIQGHEIKVSSKLLTYDEKELTAEKSCIIDEQLDGTLEGVITDNEKEIYKGNLYIGKTREYQTETKVDVNFADTLQEIRVNENVASFGVRTNKVPSEITYKNMSFNKSELLDILGEEGTISISIQDDKQIFSGKVSELTTYRDGTVILNFNEEVEQLEILLSKPEKQGSMIFKYTKQLNNTLYNRELIDQLEEIKQEATINGIYENGENTTDLQSSIKLINTTSEAELNINQENIEGGNNNEITLMATLKQNEESQDVYSNPKITIELPEDIIGISSAKFKLVHAENFNVQNAQLVNEDGKQKMKISLQGEQTNYYNDGIDGLNVVIYATLEAREVETIKQTEIKCYYENDNKPTETYEVSHPLTIVPRVKGEMETAIEENSRTEQTDSFKVDIYAARGGETLGKILAENDTVYEGETITYYIKVTNTTQKTIKDIQVIGNTTNASYYDLVAYETTFDNLPPDEETNPVRIRHQYKETDWSEKKFDKIEKLEAGESVELSYQVIVKNKGESDQKLKTTITIEQEGKENPQEIDYGEYIIKDADAKAEVLFSFLNMYEENCILVAGGDVTLKFKVKNISR